MNEEKVIAMAIAAICEETQLDASVIKVLSFKKCEQSNLQNYLKNNGLNYKKFELEDVANEIQN